MKKMSLIIVVLSLGCHEQKKTSFEKFYLIEYSWEIMDLAEGEVPPRLRLISYVEYNNDLNAIKANRKNYNSPLEFHTIEKLKGVIDSLSRVSNFFDTDTTFHSELPRVYDGPSYAFLIVKMKKKF